MSTTIDLPDPLFQRLQEQADRQGRQPQDLLAQYVEQGLARSEPTPEPEPAPDAGSRPRSAPPAFVGSAATGKTLPFRSNAELEELLLEEEIERYRTS